MTSSKTRMVVEP